MFPKHDKSIQQHDHQQQLQQLQQLQQQQQQLHHHQQQQQRLSGQSINDHQGQLSILWFKQADVHSARRTSSSAISNNSTTDIEENQSDQDSSQDVSSSPSPSNQSSRTASPSGSTPSGTPATSQKKSKSSGLRLSLKTLRTSKSQPHTDNMGRHGHQDSVEELPGPSLDRWMPLDQHQYGEHASYGVHPKEQQLPSAAHFSSSAPKSSRFSFIYSPVTPSPSTSRSSHQRSNTTPLQSPHPSCFGTSPGRSLASPSPLPVKETHTMMKDYDPTTGNKMINKYMVVRELGRGVHGKVKLCRDTETNDLCAIKIVDKTTRRRLGRSQLSNEQKIRREIAIMKKCIHPNVVRLIEVIDDPNAKKIYLVIEYMEGGEVRWKDADDKPILPLKDARSIFRDIVLGLEYLHTQGIIHRDIKPANLLLSAEGAVKISDFGVSHFSEKNYRDRDLENSPIVSKGFHVPQTGFNTADTSVRSGPPSSPISSSFPGKIPSAMGGNHHPDHLSSYQQRQLSAVAQHQQWGDDLELAKTAGSPAFFAPELCYTSEFPSALSPSASVSQSSFTTSTPAAITRTNSSSLSGGLTIKTNIHHGPRPPITKAIDIWALGVTLYCFVYGRCPFVAETEFELFNIIPRKELSLEDSIPGRDFVDANLRDLLSRLLEKDVFKRITLKEVKEHPWVTEDLPDPARWRIETDPGNYQRVHVTDEEVKRAVTIMDKIKNRIRKLSISLSNTINRRRSKSISSTYTPESPTTTEHGPIAIIRSPASHSESPAYPQAYSSSLGMNPVSLPERFHHYQPLNANVPNFGTGRLERPTSVCSNTSSIDEADEGDDRSGQSGSGSSAQNNTSYIGRRRLFHTTAQHHPQHTHQYHQYQHQHPHPLQPSAQHPHQQYSGPSSRPTSMTAYPTTIPNSSTTNSVASEDTYQPPDQATIESPLFSTSGGSRLGTSGQSGLSKSWVCSPTEVSPLSPVPRDQGESRFPEGTQDSSSREHSQAILPFTLQ